MEKPTITAAQMSVLLPQSFKTISESLAPEALNTFTQEVAELQARLDAQATANTTLKKDFDDEKAKVTALETDKSNLTNEVNRLKPFEAKVLEIQGKGEGKPKEDVNSRQGENKLPADHPNVVALEAFKAANNIK